MRQFFILVFSFSFFMCFSQNSRDKQYILSKYDPIKTKEFLMNLQNQEDSKEKRIDEFISRNSNTQNTFKRNYKSNNVLYSIFDVIDNKPVYIATDNANSAKAIKVNQLYSGGSLGLSLSGDGLTVGVWDGGWVLWNHQEFLNSNVSKISFPDSASSTPATEFHATHVAGTVAAKGVTLSAKGMAPSANLLSYNWSNDAAEVANEASANALLLSNHSYGVPVLNDQGELNVPSWYMGCYNGTAQTWDQIAYNYPYYLPVMSAGNSGNDSYSGGLAPGYDKLTGNKNAKNSLIIANANPTVNPITGSLTSLVINSSSSQGPTDDGRIKPDVAADGTSVFSTSDAGTTSYGTATGTSMASPSATGALLLLQEHYHNLYSTYMLSSSIKGLVCHTALDDATIVGPDPKFGWGLIDARESAITITNSALAQPTAIIDERDLIDSESYDIQVYVNDPKKLMATICWTDLAGTNQENQLNSSTPALINDLDLRILKDADINYPWKLQLSDVTAPAIKGDNVVDNVERVEVENASGNYIIRVTHKGSLSSGHQNYSLIVTGFDQVVLKSNTFSLDGVSVFPNPFTDMININSSISNIQQYQIFDIEGRLIKEEVVGNTSGFSINTQAFNTGVYLLKLISEKGVHSQKIIKR